MKRIADIVIMAVAVTAGIAININASDCQGGATPVCSDGSQSRLVMSDKTNATDILVLRISVKELINNNVSEWPYLRESVQKGDTQIRRWGTRRGGAKSMCSDGGKGGNVLTLTPDPGGGVYVVGTSIVFKVSCSGRVDGIPKGENTSIVIPVEGTSSGRVNGVTYQAEWKPNKPSDATR